MASRTRGADEGRHADRTDRAGRSQLSDCKAPASSDSKAPMRAVL
jgi:hypothetical protein